jgi:lysine biosynthesis protein LysW
MLPRASEEESDVTSAHCPDCDERIDLSNPRVEERLYCPHCTMELKVIRTVPLNLEWAYASLFSEDGEEDYDK